LLAAASLKVLGLAGFQTVPARGVFALPWVQVSIIYVEVLLGLWFLFAKNSALQWLAASTLFACFTTVNLFQGLQGEASCGCFGPIRANPWIVFGVDIAILGLLACFRPAFGRLGSRQDLRRYALLGSGLLVFIGVLLAGLHVGFGSWERLAASLRQESYSLSPSTVDFGSGEPGEIKEMDVVLTNWSDQPMRVVGATATCSFIAMGDYPVTVGPRQSCSLRIRVSFPSEPGRFDHEGLYYLDVDGLTVTHFQLTGICSVPK
jgi:hypothetical protein